MQTSSNWEIRSCSERTCIAEQVYDRRCQVLGHPHASDRRRVLEHLSQTWKRGLEFFGHGREDHSRRYAVDSDVEL